MLLSLLFRNFSGARNLPSQIGALTVEVTLEESHEYSAEASEFPIEGGAMIMDHVRLNPRRLTMQGFVSDTPLVARGLPLGRSRASSAFFLLELMWERRIPFVVVSQLRVYRNMVIESLVIPKEREMALRFTCTMKELTIVTGQNVMIPAAPAAAQNGGGAGALSPGNVSNPAAHAAGTDAGRQVGEAATAAETRNATFLGRLTRPSAPAGLTIPQGAEM